MKQTIYFCTSCDTPFDEETDGHIVCPNCGNTNSIEIYEYNREGESIIPEKVLVRMSQDVREWFYEKSVKLMEDLLKMEVEIKNKRFSFIYNLNSVSSNIDYLITIVESWKTFKFSGMGTIFVYTGSPGCLLTEGDWRMIMEALNTLKQESNRMRLLIERYIPVLNKLEVKGEPSWEDMLDEIDNMIKECRHMYNFFKYGVCVKETD